MTKNKRDFVKDYKANARWYRSLRHLGEMYAKEMKKDIERDKSRHTLYYTPVCADERKKHPSWYINSKTLEASNGSTD